ncbi:hypothetical protein CEXT_763041 [Caerostris extrusa]|uniref:Uncharacterized protein n=1 Tax=Caerostris extrusa TaxID=172846 RepID=A0AAV4VAH3_CAEEX|nr:hypothetical protein CEXT_763041 [Caerostris extrusa]
MNYENALIFQHKSEDLHKILDVLSDLAAEKGLSSTFHCTKENCSTSSIPLKDKSKYFPSNVELVQWQEKLVQKILSETLTKSNINVLDNSEFWHLTASFSISSANSKSSLPLNISSSTQISSSISAPLLSPSISKPILVPLPPPPLPPSLLSQIPPPPLPISIPNPALISPPFPISPLLPGVSNQIQEFQPPLNVSNPMFASSLIGESPESPPLSPNNSVSSTTTTTTTTTK